MLPAAPLDTRIIDQQAIWLRNAGALSRYRYE